MIWPLIGITAALLTSFGFVPQIIRIWKRRSAEDVSLLMLLQFTVGLSLWTAYGVYLRDPVIVGANLAGLAQLIIAIVLVLRVSRSATSL